jgi:hypothetical protein
MDGRYLIERIEGVGAIAYYTVNRAVFALLGANALFLISLPRDMEELQCFLIKSRT